MTSLDAYADDKYLSDIQKMIFSVGETFSNECLVKMIFLFSDLLTENEFQYMVTFDATNCNKIFVMVKTVLKRKQLHTNLATNVWAELLYLTKNYRYLKSLNTCKHQMKERILRGSAYFSSNFRRLLVALADDLTDEEVAYIWGRHFPGSIKAPAQPELLFHHMLLQQIITEDNLNNLLVHFQVLQRHDLLQKNEEYLKKSGLVSSPSVQYDIQSDGTSDYCGMALIFNNSTFKKQPHADFKHMALPTLTDRNGTCRDASRLQNLWEMFGIQTFVYENTDRMTFLRLLNDYLQQDLSTVKILIICILSHGEAGLFYCADRVPVKIADIEGLLGKHENLAGKPKLLFIQACQGHAVQAQGNCGAITESLEFDVRSGNAGNENQVPQFSDMLIGMATVPGFMSIRNTKEGTHFIQTLVDVLETSGDKQDLSMLVTEVNLKVAQKWATLTHRGETMRLVQMPSFRNQLTKGLRFKRVEEQKE